MSKATSHLTPQYPWYDDEDQALESRGIIRQHGVVFVSSLSGALVHQECAEAQQQFQNRKGTVCLAADKTDPNKRYMLKTVVKGSQEAANFLKFHTLRSPHNCIVPAEVVECENCLLIIMPFLTVFIMAAGFLNQTRLLSCFTTVMKVSTSLRTSYLRLTRSLGS